MKLVPGYTAITTVILLTLILTIISASIAFVSLYGRFSALGSTHSQQSKARAYACLEEALLRLSFDKTYAGGETVTLPTGTCTILAITTSGVTKTIITTANEQTSVMYYSVTVNSDTLVPVTPLSPASPPPGSASL